MSSAWNSSCSLLMAIVHPSVDHSPDGALSASTRVFDTPWRNPGSPLQSAMPGRNERYCGAGRVSPDCASLHPDHGPDSPPPQRAKLRRDHVGIGRMAVENADITGKRIHAVDEFRRDGRIVVRQVAPDQPFDQPGLLRRKQL